MDLMSLLVDPGSAWLVKVVVICVVVLVVAQISCRSALQPFQRVAWFQIDTDMAHVQNKWNDDSRFLVQRWQKYPFSQPRRCRCTRGDPDKVATKKILSYLAPKPSRRWTCNCWSLLGEIANCRSS